MEKLKDSIQKTIDLVNINGYDLLAIKPISAHPDDFYLTAVLVDRHEEYNPYVGWLCNTSGNPGFYYGHYFESLKDAIKHFNERS